MKSTLMTFIIAFTCFISHAGDEKQPSSIRFAGIPALGFGPDSGFGFGVVGGMYMNEVGFHPYKMALGLKVYLTTKGIHSHVLSWDQLRPFDLPVRLLSRIGFYKTIAQNYYGRAADARYYDDNDASLEADKRKLQGSDRDEFLRHYYKHRFMSFFGDLSLRWLLWKDQAKLELMTNYRGAYYLNGDFNDRSPYEGSLYAKDFSHEKTEGYLSTLELGLMLDKRDIESAPTRGYWLESSIRGGASIFGSAWNYFGANAAARFYFPLDDARSLVIASQTIVDSIVGDLPYDAMSRIGGSQSFNDFTGIGGQYLGRGIREQRFVGRLKLIEQAELRYNFFSFSVLKQNFDLVAAALGDFGMTAWDYSRLGRDLKNVYMGFGTGLRIYWNKTFVIRSDLAVSPQENFIPQFYLTVGNVF